jgi:hypothetical protein
MCFWDGRNKRVHIKCDGRKKRKKEEGKEMDDLAHQQYVQAMHFQQQQQQQQNGLEKLQESVASMKTTKDEILDLNTQIKAKKLDLEKVEKFCIDFLFEIDKAYIDASMIGHGPYICLDKCTSEPALKDSQLLEIFQNVIIGVQQGQIKDAEQCLQYYKHIKSSNQVRNIKLSQKRSRPNVMESASSIKLWKENMDQPQVPQSQFNVNL